MSIEFDRSNEGVWQPIERLARFGEPDDYPDLHDVHRRGKRSRRRRVWSQRSLVVAATLAMGTLTFALVGVGSNRPPDQVAAKPTGESPVISAERPIDVLPVALISGRLELSNGCLVLAGQGVLFWLQATSWDAASSQVVAPNGKRFTLDERMEAAGGFYRDSQPDVLPALAGPVSSTRVERCREATGLPAAILAYPN